jgi:hypothetical protein
MGMFKRKKPTGIWSRRRSHPGSPGRVLTLLPLGDRILVDAVTPGQCPHALLTMLHRSTDRLCPCGAPV